MPPRSFSSTTPASNSIYTIENAVNEDLMLLKARLDENKPSLNVAKTHNLLIGRRYKTKPIENSFEFSLSVGNEPISSVADTKYLGLHVDQYLNWEQHVFLKTKKFPKA